MLGASLRPRGRGHAMNGSHEENISRDEGDARGRRRAKKTINAGQFSQS